LSAQCTTIKPSGERCRGVPVRGSSFCAAHHPATQERRRRGARKGGRRTSRGRPTAAELDQVRGEIRATIARVFKGDIPPNVGSVMFMGYNTLLRTAEVQRRLIETDDLAEQLDELKAEVEVRKRRGNYVS
jgi:hypothetical protein